ncbi:MAG: tetratricopeptide repeat protein [Nitrospirae bacterium]|nr:tetratricopeptide repeat protein [Nitrospirota bacterium]
MKKEKYLQLFRYLFEFSKLRNKSVRDIEFSESQYTEILWFNDIPQNELFENIIRPEFNADNDYWIKISKPKEPSNPVFATLPQKIQSWVEPSSLLNEDKEPTIKETIIENGKTLILTDFPEIKDEFNKYVKGKWFDDLIDYSDKYDKYLIENKKYEELNETYKKFIKIHNKNQQFGEEYELIVGVGLLNFKEKVDMPKICRHIIIQKVDISIPKNDNSINITPNIESFPKIETDAIIDLTEQFDTWDISDAEIKAEAKIKEKEIYHLFTDNLIKDALQIFADRFSPDGEFKDIIEKPNKLNNKPIIYFSPALILRKRNTRSLTALYETIIKNIENGNDTEIPSIDDIIGLQENIDNDPQNSQDPTFGCLYEPIFFPKEYNGEQIEIVEKARKNYKVLVQGPPGTGKSHTIANLICHLLANGKKVLVTAYTQRALKVLKDKLPPEFQNLTVNLLSGDKSSLKSLENSVEVIKDELSNLRLDYQKNEIDSLDKMLNILRENIAYNTNELKKIKEKSYKEEFNPNYKGTLTEIAENIESDTSHFSWYKDSYCDIKHETIINDLQSFIELNDKYYQKNTSEFDFEFPNILELPTIEQVKLFESSREKLLKYNCDKKYNTTIKCAYYAELKSILIKHLDYVSQLRDLHIDIKLKNKLINSYLKDGRNILKQKLNLSSKIIDSLKELDFKQVNLIEYDIFDFDLIQVKKQIQDDAETLLKYIEEGNSISGWLYTIKKLFLDKKIKNAICNIRNIKVNRRHCSADKLKIVIQDIKFQQDFIELSELLDQKILEGKYIEKLLFFQNVLSEITTLIKILDDLNSLKSNIKDYSNIDVKLIDHSKVTELINECGYNQLLNEFEKYEGIINRTKEYLSQDDFHPIAKDIFNVVTQIPININSYEQLFKKTHSIIQNKNEYQEFENLKIQLQKIFPNLIKEIITTNKFTIDDLSRLRDAIYFKHAQNELNRLISTGYEESLLEKLNEFEKQEKKFIAQLASKKAWYKVIERLEQNKNLRQHLTAWVQAIKRISKTGKGKSDLKWKKTAQKEMDECKISVPCWIMPLYKVAETINPMQEMFDCVIVDEASQLGPDAIFLHYISKNIIIVGDDKQTSPEYVGINTDSMQPNINKYLNNIPFNEFYNIAFSFFDHAAIFCNGRTVLLEHFRCMPEIIEFSNKNFYDGKLIILKQYSENRLDPLISVYCQEGYAEGTGSNIFNKPEAKKIVETIARLIRDKKYDGKTFGVISLQGDKQSGFIENLLLNEIGALEFNKRGIICGDSASFQGDERDIIFLSLVTAHNHDRRALTSDKDGRRFNVAASRAKEQEWLFHSVQLDELSNTNDLRYKLLDHVKNYRPKIIVQNTTIKRTIGTQPEPFDSWFEVDVFNDIVKKGYSVIPQYKVAKGRYRIDLVVLCPNGVKFAIECDGDRWHGVEQYEQDMMRQRVLERCGWQFFRVRGYEYYTNRVKALEQLWRLLSKNNINTHREAVPQFSTDLNSSDNTEESEDYKEDIEQNGSLEQNKANNDTQLPLSIQEDSYNQETSSFNDTIRDYDKTIEPQSTGYCSYLNEKGLSLYNNGNYEDAINHFNKIIKVNPQYSDAYYNRGNSYYCLGNYQHAINDYNKAIELKPQNVESYYSRGLSYQKSGNYTQAKKDYNKAIEINPQKDVDYFFQGNSYHELGNEKQTIKNFNIAAKMGNKLAQDYLNKIGINWEDKLVESEKEKKEQNIIRNRIDITPLKVPTTKDLINKGLSFCKNGNYQEAIKCFNIAIGINSKYAMAYLVRGTCYDKLSNYQQAIEDFTKAIKLIPQYAEAYYNRGASNGKLGNYQQAIEDFTQTIKLNSKDADAYNSRGFAYSKLGKDDQAIKDFEMAIMINPQLVEAYVQRGLSYHSINNDLLSIEDYKIAARLGDNNSQKYLKEKSINWEESKKE